MTTRHTPWPDRIRAIRKAKGWSQSVAARELGYSYQSLVGWEQGRKDPSQHPAGRTVQRINDLEREIEQEQTP